MCRNEGIISNSNGSKTKKNKMNLDGDDNDQDDHHQDDEKNGGGGSSCWQSRKKRDDSGDGVTVDDADADHYDYYPVKKTKKMNMNMNMNMNTSKSSDNKNSKYYHYHHHHHHQPILLSVLRQRKFWISIFLSFIAFQIFLLIPTTTKDVIDDDYFNDDRNQKTSAHHHSSVASMASSLMDDHHHDHDSHQHTHDHDHDHDNHQHDHQHKHKHINKDHSKTIKKPLQEKKTTTSSSSDSHTSTSSSSSSGQKSSHNKEEKKPSSSQQRINKPFSFFLMGDLPYSEWEESMLRYQIEDMNQRTTTISSSTATHSNNKNNTNQSSLQQSLFTIHVGDIQKAHRTGCAESHYARMSRLLRSSVLPVFTIPGDNDWYDCPDRSQAWNYFKTHFIDYDDDKNDDDDDDGIKKQSDKKKNKSNSQNWKEQIKQNVGIVEYYDENHKEMFAFQKEGILFVSIHLIHTEQDEEDGEPPEHWDHRMERNIEWVNRIVQTYVVPTETETTTSLNQIRGVLIIGHSLRSPRTRPFFEGIAGNFINGTHRMQNMPVLYLHGDGHDWDVDTKFSEQLGWRYYRDIQVDQGGLADPCLVQIAGQDDRGRTVPLQRERDSQYVFGAGLFRIDRQKGRYSQKQIQKFAEKSKQEKRKINLLKRKSMRGREGDSIH